MLTHRQELIAYATRPYLTSVKIVFLYYFYLFGLSSLSIANLINIEKKLDTFHNCPAELFLFFTFLLNYIN